MISCSIFQTHMKIDREQFPLSRGKAPITGSKGLTRYLICLVASLGHVNFFRRTKKWLKKAKHVGRTLENYVGSFSNVRRRISREMQLIREDAINQLISRKCH